MRNRNYPFEKTDGGRADAGLPTERRDCVVRAVALAFGMPYAEVHHLAATEWDRKPRCGTYPHKYHSWINRQATKKIIHPKEPMTIRTFLREYPVGTFICNVAGHAFAVRNGVILDSWQQSDLCRIKHAWRVMEPAK